MNTKLAVVLVLFFIILAAGVALIAIPAPVAQAPAPVDQTPATSTNPLANRVVVDSPKPNEVLSSTTLMVTGKARGGWFFEGSSPVELRDSSDNTLVLVPTQTADNWMTDEFVPFTATLTFPKQPAGSKGTLILRNDNPSGMPQYAEQIEIPVVFK